MPEITPAEPIPQPAGSVREKTERDFPPCTPVPYVEISRAIYDPTATETTLVELRKIVETLLKEHKDILDAVPDFDPSKSLRGFILTYYAASMLEWNLERIDKRLESLKNQSTATSPAPQQAQSSENVAQVIESVSALQFPTDDDEATEETVRPLLLETQQQLSVLTAEIQRTRDPKKRQLIKAALEELIRKLPR